MTVRRSAFVLASVLLAGCGSGGKVLPPFLQGVVVGTGGGTLETQTIRLNIPAGAFTGDLVLVILPQPDPLPIDPAAGAIDYMPGIMCIAPIGQALLIDGHVRMCYSPADIPAGSSETDLVLLEYDAVAGFMRVSLPAVQDLLRHCFDDFDYAELGHIAIGVRTSLDRSLFVYPNDSGNNNTLTQGDTAPGVTGPISTASLGWGIRIGGVRDTFGFAVISNTADVSEYLPSIDGQRILFTVDDNQNESTTLHTVDLNQALDFPARQLADSSTFSTSDPLFGWLEGGGDKVYIEASPDLTPVIINGPTLSFDRISATGAPPPASWSHPHPNSGSFLDDLRQSPDGSKTLLRYIVFGKGTFSAYDVVRNDTGATVESNVLSDLSDPNRATPRWLPDGTGFYYVDPASSDEVVRAVDVDGSNGRVLYSLFDSGDRIEDFVLAPDYDEGDLANSRCAYVVLPFDSGTQDLVTDTLADGDPFANSLDGEFFVNEMAWRPDGDGVLLDLEDAFRDFQPEGNIILPLASRFVHFADSEGFELRRINATMGDLDVDRDTSEIMIWISSSRQDAAFSAAGIYLLGFDKDPDVLVVPGDFSTPPFRATGPARFIHSWRRSPGFDFTGHVR